jgi:hypothetical protein
MGFAGIKPKKLVFDYYISSHVQIDHNWFKSTISVYVTFVLVQVEGLLQLACLVDQGEV